MSHEHYLLPHLIVCFLCDRRAVGKIGELGGLLQGVPSGARCAISDTIRSVVRYLHATALAVPMLSAAALPIPMKWQTYNLKGVLAPCTECKVLFVSRSARSQQPCEHLRLHLPLAPDGAHPAFGITVVEANPQEFDIKVSNAPARRSHVCLFDAYDLSFRCVRLFLSMCTARPFGTPVTYQLAHAASQYHLIFDHFGSNCTVHGYSQTQKQSICSQ